jgi:hypothetical protein
MDKIRCWLFIAFFTAFRVYSQNADSVLLPADTTSFSSGDSLSIFLLIDSLLNLDDALGSQLALRAGYNSNVLSAGRTLGIENFGLTQGMSYYHKTGFYADVSGFWSKDFEPSYYLTIASLGYMKDINRHITVMAGYDRYFYHFADADYIPYTNTLSVTPILEFKPVSFSANYSFYFGEQSVHRIMPGLSVTLETKKLMKIDRIAIMPSIFMLMGNAIVTSFEYVLPPTNLERRQNIRNYGSPYNLIQINKNVFGIMNYAISIPLNILYKKWGISFTYTYNIPKALPGEPLTFSESTYLSGSLMYIIDLKRQRNTL